MTAETSAAPAVPAVPVTAPARTKTVRPRKEQKPLLYGRKPRIEIVFLWIFVTVPLLALAAAVPVFWGWGMSWSDVGIYLFFHFFTGFGITVGFHRYLTHGAFKAKRWLRILLAFAG